MTDKRVCVIGAGGHAKVVIRLLQDLGYEVGGVLDDNSALWATTVCGVPVLGPIDAASKFRFSRGVVAVGDNRRRQAIVERTALDWVTAVHPRAFMDASVKLGAGTVVLPMAVIQEDSVLGDHVIVNVSATVAHDARIGSFAHLGPNSGLAGNVEIGAGTLLGVGACVIPGMRVGAWSTVGAGAVVISPVGDDLCVVGCPAKPVSEFRSETRANSVAL